VFGESILNDAVAIVLASTVVESEHSGDLSSSERFWNGIGRFLVTFLGSAGE
jgi:sodium/hydrogen exchanger 8